MGKRAARSDTERLTYRDLEKAVACLKAMPEADTEKVWHEIIRYWREKVMSITEMRAKKVMAGPGNFAYIAEAKVVDGNGKEVYVTVNYYDGTEYTVQEQSVYDFLAGYGDEPCVEFAENYGALGEAKNSAYAEVFSLLCDEIDKLG